MNFAPLVVTSFQIFRNFATSYNFSPAKYASLWVVTSFQIFRNFATSYNPIANHQY